MTLELSRRRHMSLGAWLMLALLSAAGGLFHGAAVTAGSFDFLPAIADAPFSYDAAFSALLYGGDGSDVRGLSGAIAPALLRGLFLPFLDMSTVAVAPAIIWGSVVIGGFAATLLWVDMVREARLSRRWVRLPAVLAGLLAIWFVSPLVLLSARPTAEAELAAIAFAACMWSLRILVPLAVGQGRAAPALPALAVLSALALFSVPTMGFGLILATLVVAHAAVADGRRGEGRYWDSPVILVAGAMLLAAGSAYMTSDAVRLVDMAIAQSVGPLSATGGETLLAVGGDSVIWSVTQSAWPALGTPTGLVQDTDPVGASATMVWPVSATHGPQDLLLSWPLWICLAVLGCIAIVPALLGQGYAANPRLLCAWLIGTAAIAAASYLDTDSVVPGHLMVWPLLFALSLAALPGLLRRVDRPSWFGSTTLFTALFALIGLGLPDQVPAGVAAADLSRLVEVPGLSQEVCTWRNDLAVITGLFDPTACG